MPEAINIPQEHSIFAMVLGSGTVVQGVLLILIALSVLSWAVAVAKIIQFRKAGQQSKKFNQVFWESRNFARIDETSERLGESPLATIFHAGYRELRHIIEGDSKRADAEVDFETDIETVERALKRAEHGQALRLEWGVTFLATVASAAPFIGLFGTVWGIMNAFHGLSSAKSTTLQAVAPGISEALVATAIGLAAAIPAAVAYNYFAVAVRRFKEAMDKFSAEFLNVARRYILK